MHPDVVYAMLPQGVAYVTLQIFEHSKWGSSQNMKYVKMGIMVKLTSNKLKSRQRSLPQEGKENSLARLLMFYELIRGS